MIMKLLRILPLLVLVACSDATEPAQLRVVSAVLSEVMPHVQELEVVLSEAAPLRVTWTEMNSTRALSVASAASRTHVIPLTRLRAGRSYVYEIEGTGRFGYFTTNPLPPDLAAVTFTASGSPTVPLVMVNLYEPDGFTGYAIVDSEGEVVWHFRTVDFPYGSARRSNGNFVFMDRARGLVEVTPEGREVRNLPQDPADREQHHDVIATPQNTLLFIAFDGRDFEGSRLLGEAIWEWTPETGEVVRRWSSWDHFSPATDRGPRFGAEWLHANSLAWGPRGNVLLSVHYLNQVISIAPGWDAVEWRLGGVNATLPVTGDAQFSGQHTAAEIAQDRVLLFDNGHERGGYSRALEFSLAGGTAEIAWQWRPAVDNYAAIVSSARRLSNGNTLVGFGTRAGVVGASGPTEVYEVTPAGAVIWHLLVNSPQIIFRAEPIAGIGSEAPVSP